MKIKSILFVAILSVLTAACAKKEQKTAVKSSRSARSPYVESNNGSGIPSVNSPAGISGKVWGAMTQGSLSNQQFTTSVKMFVSSLFDPQALGSISGTQFSNTGIRFWGAISTTAAVSTTGFNNVQITSNSMLRLSIWDSFAGKQDQEGNLVPEIGIFMDGYEYGQVQGYVYGTYAHIYFEDQYGSVGLNGNIQGSKFVGYLSFSNNQYWDGAAPGASATDVWAFEIPTCSFFNCQ